MSLADHLFDRAASAIRSIPDDTRGDIYVVSFFVYDEGDDPRLPTVTVGFNTESMVADCCRPRTASDMASAFQDDDELSRSMREFLRSRGDEDVTNDPEECRWNYAFYLQNELEVILDTDRDPIGSELRARWCEGRAEMPDGWTQSRLIGGMSAGDWELYHRAEELITGEFIRMTVDVIRRLHADGVVSETFGRTVPILIHELEYHDDIGTQNLAANPPGTVDAFAAWCGA